ncbi:ABC transporter permease subunit [Bacillus sp. FSL K6-0047]|uniref:ABC transporter permease subunit n=1 Tax=Shouchella rhizosphaerae TaxID=866786 RepID=UPI00203BB4CB|nr:ABC transporter permease subunit [Shouchella rhizosphaerae]MCM3378496.1 ABC transporter permease subunit [Shouchella rhizosphaerae]
MNSWRQWYQDGVAPWIVPLLLLLSWQFMSVYGLFSHLLASPLEVVQAACRMIANGELVSHMATSFYRALAGFIIGGGLGLLLGIANGLSPFSRKYLDSTIQMLRNVPNLALIPLVVIYMGVGESAKIFLVAVGVLFPVYINTFHGIRSIDQNMLEMSKMYGLSKWKLFTKVIFPGALPSILVGIRYALGVMWVTLIVAETIAATSGIGYMSMNAREFMQVDVIILAILLYALLGKLADTLATFAEKRLLRWNPAYR